VARASRRSASKNPDRMGRKLRQVGRKRGTGVWRNRLAGAKGGLSGADAPVDTPTYLNRAANSRRSFATFGATTAWQYIRVGFRWKYC
jgi:hypothetical protein